MSLSEPTMNEDKLIATALVGLDIVAVISMLSVQLDNALRVSLYSFAASIPFLTAGSLILLTAKSHHYATRWHIVTMVIIGVVGSVVGIGAIFWHFSWIICLVFIVASLAGLMIWSVYDEPASQPLEKSNDMPRQ